MKSLLEVQHLSNLKDPITCYNPLRTDSPIDQHLGVLKLDDRPLARLTAISLTTSTTAIDISPGECLLHNTMAASQSTSAREIAPYTS